MFAGSERREVNCTLKIEERLRESRKEDRRCRIARIVQQAYRSMTDEKRKIYNIL